MVFGPEHEQRRVEGAPGFAYDKTKTTWKPAANRELSARRSNAGDVGRFGQHGALGPSLSQLKKGAPGQGRRNGRLDVYLDRPAARRADRCS